MERVITPQIAEDDLSFDPSLRPRSLNEYIGQEKVKENLRVFIEAAKARGEALDHLLFYGPPGLGKTTLAYIISQELNVNIKTTSGPVIERAGDLAAILDQIEHWGRTAASSPLSHSLPDIDDEPFLEVAVAGKVACLITGNSIHFPSKLCKGVKVLSPSEFLSYYKKQQK